ncbi:hypothetical protein ACFE04_006139 [Oxalis oulophora]
MDKEGKSQKGAISKSTDTEMLLQWGNSKKHRCVKVKKEQNMIENHGNKLATTDTLPKKKITSGVKKEFPSPQQPTSQYNKNCDLQMNARRSLLTSPEKEDRYYNTRGSMGIDIDNGKLLINDEKKEDKKVAAWPKMYITLSSKEKEEDFMAMKGCKPAHRPKKRAKLIQRSVFLACPGTWLSDLCQERYEVREKKTSKKKPRGLKAMGGLESDSEPDGA